MRKRSGAVFGLLFAFVLTALVVSFVYGQEDPGGGDPNQPEQDEVITGIVAFDGAYVYVGPDFAYAIIGQLPLNGSIVVLGRRGDFFTVWDGRQWLEVQYGGRSAWVYARLIRTSIPFNSIPPTGSPLPRDNNGRVPEIFDLNGDICDTWPQGPFTLSGDFQFGSTELTVTYPGMPGATVYSVITLSPSGFRTAFDSETTTALIDRSLLPREYGTYTWRVVPYWTNRDERYYWQQLCLLRTGGTFVLPPPPTPTPTPGPSPTPRPTPQS